MRQEKGESNHEKREVGRREEGGEGSAWPLCSGLPSGREKGVGRRG